MSQLKTLREIDSPFDDSSIKAAINSVHSDVLGDHPSEPYEAIFYLIVATWRFALQFADDFETARSIVLDVWGSPSLCPDPSGQQTPDNGGEPLPGWLEFQADRLIFTATPPVDQEDTVEVEVVATDLDGRTAKGAFAFRRS